MDYENVRVLIVEDDDFDFKIVQRELQRASAKPGSDCKFTIERSSTFDDALKILQLTAFDVILLDFRLPDSEGIDSLLHLRSSATQCPIIVMTGLDDQHLAIESLKLGAQNYIVKSSFQQPIDRIIRFAIERHAILQRLKQAERDAIAAKDREHKFMATMSHEIRTPLTAILGFSELLSSFGECNDAQRTAVSTIRRNGQHLLSLINDMLDYSKIESGHLSVTKVPMSSIGLLEEVRIALHDMARSKGIELKADITAPLPACITSDPLRIRQILINIVSNAIKFTSSGSVTICLEADLERHNLLYRVKDTGPGMSEQELSNLFKPFHKVNDLQEKFGGTGLGLSISKTLASMLSGSLSVESKLGAGTSIELALPITEAECSQLVYLNEPLEAESYPTKPEDLELKFKGKILLVDDCEDNRSLIKNIAGLVGLDIDLACNGQLAIEMAQNRKYDLVLMDVQMPVMNGLEATQILRESGYQQPIVFLTAALCDHQMQEYLQAGGNYCLKKPFRKADLFKVFGMYLSTDSSEIELSTQDIISAAEQEIVSRYKENLPNKIETLESLLSRGDWNSLQSMAHKLAGAEMFGLPEIGSLAHLLEVSCVEHQHARCTELVSQLKNASLLHSVLIKHDS